VGFAFMAIEIALMQRFTLFLGHPTFSLLVILFVVLLATATGARLSERFETARLPKVMLIAGVALGVLTIIYGLVLGDLLRSMIGVARPLRIIITGVLVAPCGLLMGVMIPSVIRVLGVAGSPMVPWGWGVNGATSVIGTSIATIIAMYVGFTATFFVGAVTYAGAGVLGLVVARGYLARASATSVIGTSIATIIAMYVGFTATFFVGAVTYAGAGVLGLVVARGYLARASRPSAEPSIGDPAPEVPLVPPAARQSSPTVQA